MDIKRRCVEEGLCACGTIHERKGRALQVTHDGQLKKKSDDLSEEEESFDLVDEA